MNELQASIFEKGRFVIQEKSDHFRFLAISVHIICDAKVFSRNIIVERCSADTYSLIEIMRAEIEKDESSLFIKTFHAIIHLLTFSACQVSVFRNQT